MTTKLNAPLKRELTIGGKPWPVGPGPTHTTRKRFRRRTWRANRAATARFCLPLTPNRRATQIAALLSRADRRPFETRSMLL